MAEVVNVVRVVNVSMAAGVFKLVELATVPEVTEETKWTK